MKKASIIKYLKMSLPVLIVSAVLWFFFIREKNNTVFVRKVELKNRVVVRTVTASGSIASNLEAELSFQTAGKIAKINVKEGAEVKKGQLLAYLDSTYQNETVQYYKDALDIKIRQKELFLDDYKANKELYGGDKRYNMKLREYEEGVSQAEAAYQAQLAVVNNAYIYAPFNGTVTQIAKNTGETATIGESVITVADLKDLLFKIKVDQEDFGLLKKGMAAEVKFDSYENEVFIGKVLTLPYYANTSTEQFDIEIKIASKKGKPLILGMKGDAYIILETSGNEVPSLTVDEVSYDESDKPFVWVLENGKIKKQPVEFGIEGDVFIEIKNATDKTILVSSKETQKMVEGYKAKVIN
jgi:RND family efflux transporter MFP subunit